ncbi:MAG: leucine-rich repeat protein [Clostridia bacterium]|nr:leucine-rich repeat protein [Clostridia bacterium]
MKMWKMLGCLALLCVIICGCVAMGNGTRVDAADGAPEQSAPSENESSPPTQAQRPTKTESESGGTTVDKTYSEGLRYRSNGDGTCAVAGVGSCTAACILIPPQSPAGDTVTEILPYAFSGSIVGAIEIPSSVRVLSAESFAGCTRLAYLQISASNGSFLESDGALYSKDGRVLLYCPPGRSGSSLVLHANLTRVAAGAFAACSDLQTVTFQGSIARWQAVTVGDDNEALYAASLRFTAE